MEEIKILEELRRLIPPLKKEELEQLHRELDSDGRAMHPLIVWKQEGVLVDGHHRYDYCKKNGYPFEVRSLSFASIDAVKNHMILHQLGRRNLDPKEASRLRGTLYNSRKKERGGAKQKAKGQNDPLDTADNIAEKTGVSPKTIKRDAKYAEACDAISAMANNGDITGEEKDQVMAKSKTQIIKASKSPDAAKKAVKPKPRQPKKEPYEKVVIAFERLDGPQREKAFFEIDRIRETQ